MIKMLMLLSVIGIVIFGLMGFPGISDPHKSLIEKDGTTRMNEIEKKIPDFLSSSGEQKEAANGKNGVSSYQGADGGSKSAKGEQNQVKTSESAVTSASVVPPGSEVDKKGSKENQNPTTEAQKNGFKGSNDAEENNAGVGADKQKRSAYVRIMASKFNLEENHSAMTAVVVSPIAGNVDPNTEVARVTITLVLENVGEDSTPFVKFYSTFQIDGGEVKSVKTELGNLGAGEKISREFTYSVKVSDIPPSAINKIVKHITDDTYPVFSFEIKNIDFKQS